MKKIKSMSSVMRTSAFVGCIMIPVSFVIFLVAGFSDPEELHLFDVVVQPGMSILDNCLEIYGQAQHSSLEHLLSIFCIDFSKLFRKEKYLRNMQCNHYEKQPGFI